MITRTSKGNIAVAPQGAGQTETRGEARRRPIHDRSTKMSSRHEAFAQAVAGGEVSAGEAYRKLYPKSKSWETDGPRLLRNAQVAKRIAKLKAEQAVASKLSRDDLRRWCERVIMATPNQAGPDSDICETVMTKSGPVATICSKLGAMDRLIRLCGLDKGTEAENKVSNSMGDLLARIRTGRTPYSYGSLPNSAGSADAEGSARTGL